MLRCPGLVSPVDHAPQLCLVAAVPLPRGTQGTGTIHQATTPAKGWLHFSPSRLLSRESPSRAQIAPALVLSRALGSNTKHFGCTVRERSSQRATGTPMRRDSARPSMFSHSAQMCARGRPMRSSAERPDTSKRRYEDIGRNVRHHAPGSLPASGTRLVKVRTEALRHVRRLASRPLTWSFVPFRQMTRRWGTGLGASRCTLPRNCRPCKVPHEQSPPSPG